MASIRTRVLALLAAGGVGVGVAVAPAQAETSRTTVVASGLDNPRLLSFSPDGDLYVAESGRGGSGPCATHPELGKFCFGESGAITRVSPNGSERRVVTGLPSLGGADDSIGPMDVDVRSGGRYVVSIGLGAHPDFRKNFGSGGAHLGTLLTGRLGDSGHTLLADIAAYEAEANPDKTDLDSNPAGISRRGGGYDVADAGGNSVVRTTRKGDVSTVSVLAPVPTTSAITMGTETIPAGFPQDAVPTSVVRGPDGALYISQLTGFPFQKGTSSIWRLESGGKLRKWATGLTNVTDLAFSEDGHLYAVQISSEGLLNGPMGSLVRVKRGSSTHHTVVGGLFAPYGVAIDGDDAYVSTCSVCVGKGEVLRVSLD
jgi:sugar lactone lactonase YvrE